MPQLYSICALGSDVRQIYYTILVLGVVGVGGIFTGTNPSYTHQELVHHVKVARVKYFISEPELLGPIEKAAAATGTPRSNILIFDVHGQKITEGYQSWTTLLAHGEEDWIRFDDEKRAKNTTATRLFSSGTTGLPKAVDHSHTNLIAQHTLVFEKYAKPFEVSFREIQVIHYICHLRGLTVAKGTIYARSTHVSRFNGANATLLNVSGRQSYVYHAKIRTRSVSCQH